MPTLRSRRPQDLFFVGFEPLQLSQRRIQTFPLPNPEEESGPDLLATHPRRCSGLGRFFDSCSISTLTSLSASPTTPPTVSTKMLEAGLASNMSLYSKYVQTQATEI